MRFSLRSRIARSLRLRKETANFSRPSDPIPLAETSIALYFGSSLRSFYQIEPWLASLESVAERHEVVIILRDHETFLATKRRTELPAVFVHSYSDLGQLVEPSGLKAVLYVNHASANYQMLRFSSMLHVHIGHGESDKKYMAANQAKAYDYVFVAGQAGIDRLTRSLYSFNADNAIPIGRSQIVVDDHQPTDPPTVLYAPTYEGDLPGSSHTSVSAIGVQLVRRLLDSGAFSLVYRPHPLTGVHDPEAAKADNEIRRLVATAGSPNKIDSASPIHNLMSDASILIGDKSSVVVDWLAYGRPYLITAMREEDSSPIFEAGTKIDTSNVTEVVKLAQDATNMDHKDESRQSLAKYHLGIDANQDATVRFVSAVSEVVRKRDEWIAHKQSESEMASGWSNQTDSMNRDDH